MFSEREIIRVNEKKRKVIDYVADEKLFEIYVNNKKILTSHCSPYNLDLFLYGFLFTSGLIANKDGVGKICFNENKIFVKIINNRKQFSNREIGNFSISAEKVIKLTNKFLKKGKVFKKTGGTHMAGISTIDDIIFTVEDIGKINAIDKVIGYAILNDIELSDKILLITGRITSVAVEKCKSAKISIIISKAPPTILAIEKGENFGITIIGFSRDGRFNIYTLGERIND